MRLSKVATAITSAGISAALFSGNIWAGQKTLDYSSGTGTPTDVRDGFSVKDVGYNPEIYVGEEQEKGGLRVVRDEEGRPVKPVFEINDGN